MPTESQLPDRELEGRVRQRIEDGRLPVTRPEHIDGGYGSGRPCAACEQLIAPTKIEYEVIDPRNGQRLPFHFACYVSWQRECTQRMAGPEQRRTGGELLKNDEKKTDTPTKPGKPWWRRDRLAESRWQLVGA
jgi:hypothetical protein